MKSVVYQFSLLVFIIAFQNAAHTQTYRIIESTLQKITIEIDFTGHYMVSDTVLNGTSYTYIIEKGHSWRQPGEPWLPTYSLNLGIPHSANPQVRIIREDSEIMAQKFVYPFPLFDPQLDSYNPQLIDQAIYSKNSFFPQSAASLPETFIMRYARIQPLSIEPFQFNPVTRELKRNKNIIIEVLYNVPANLEGGDINDSFTTDFIKSGTINSEFAINWLSSSHLRGSSIDGGNYWYDPDKQYFKIYLNKKDVYRLTFEELQSAGVPFGAGVESNKLELIVDGEQVALDIYDGGDSLFNAGDFFQFIGRPSTPTPYSYQNIYNKTNVYWFSIEGNNPLRYDSVLGFPTNYQRTFTSTKNVVHYEKDSIYERLGYAQDGNRDYWFWGKASAQSGQSTGGFESYFDIWPAFNSDSNKVKLRVNLHGMINTPYCFNDNKAHIELTGQQLGSIHWEGQSIATFEKEIFVSPDSIQIYPEGNILRVWNYGDACPNFTSGEIRVNWFQFEYWRRLWATDNHFFFKAPESFPGINRYWINLFQRDNMKVYVPSRNIFIYGAQILNDVDGTVLFQDNTFSDPGTEYFCVSSDYFKSVDSIGVHTPSNLRATTNGADYLIVTHPEFLPQAQRLASFREQNFPDTGIANPRILIVDVFDIYDEFSYGLVDPFALQSFFKYTFQDWVSPAPAYVVLFGDMSYDYRKIRASSRRSFIPSIPFYSFTYGQAASDNMIVAVVGDDVTPDAAIGRISCETLEEAKILIDKIIEYPNDPSKIWKQNVLLLSSGLSAEDENSFGFNDANLLLDNFFLKPNGFSSSKVFRYPTKPEHFPFQGEGPKIRQEFNKGTVFANYYGHGGGYQWDLVFVNDDIYTLENAGRLPFISSVTCYTAHFDNQDVFGEQFNKVPGKGSIAFFGSSGLTFWGVGKDINQRIFQDVFTNRNYILGKSILNAKSQVPGIGIYGIQVALLTLLGDPVLKLALPNLPDFEISNNDISYSPAYPLVGDTVQVKIKYRNLGVIFPSDTIKIQLFASSQDTSYLVGEMFRTSFPFTDSLTFQWTPESGGIYSLNVKINLDSPINEMDQSDNTATKTLPVFNINEPNVIKPFDGKVVTGNKIDFLFTDIGHYIERELTYYIEINTTPDFSSPLISSGSVLPNTGIIQWTSPVLQPGVYFWRSRIFDGENFGNWGATRSFSLMPQNKNGYYAHSGILETYSRYNINYDESSGALLLNTSLLPPKPAERRFLGDITFADSSLADTLRITTIATDGTFIYFGCNWFHAINVNNNPDGYSRIYKVGTGRNGTTAGEFYGHVSDFYGRISNTLFYHQGYIYVGIGKSHSLLRVDPVTGDTTYIAVEGGLIRWEDASEQDGDYYLTSDGTYVYNLTLFDTAGNNRYVIRKLDPQNNWAKVGEDQVIFVSSYVPGFSGFFVYDDYLFVTENFFSNYMRRINLQTGLFEEEWLLRNSFNAYFAWTFDTQNNVLYASVFKGNEYKAKFGRFIGTYIDANGTIETAEVGPAHKWNSVSYNIQNPSTTGNYSVDLLGFNRSAKIWDTLAINIQPEYQLNNVLSSEYPALKLFFTFTDTSLGASEPMKLIDVNFDYLSLPELIVNRNDISFTPDSLLQGYPLTMNSVIRNLGYSDASGINMKFYLNDSDTAFYQTTIDIKADSSKFLSDIISTSPLIFENEVRMFADYSKPEFYTYNNIMDKSFFVARDSVKPVFSITFDGKEIINGDIVSAKPEILISLNDNSPLPLDRSLFTVIYNNIPLNYYRPDVRFDSTFYPNTGAQLTWTPELPDGRHTLEVLAKDASGNFFDSTSTRLVFFVYNDADLREVYNYPNPFKDDTHFTFELRGATLPEELYLKVYTVAGRLIRSIEIPQSQLQIGFNRYYWDGRDQDGDEIANGVYFYKVVMKNGDVIKTATQKLAKVK